MSQPHPDAGLSTLATPGSPQGLLSNLIPVGGVVPGGGIVPGGGVVPGGGIVPGGGVLPVGGVVPGGFSGLSFITSASMVAMRNSLVQGLAVDPAAAPNRAAVGAAPWKQWGPAHRAQALLGEALSGLRVRAESDKETAHLERLVETAGRLTWVPIGRWCRPPAAFFAAQTALVDGLMPSRETRIAEIHEQAGNSIGYLCAAAQLPLHRLPRTLEFLASALGLMMVLQMQLKQALACPRPHVLQPLLTPLIDTPAHGSLPSGHAGESALVALLLSRWLKVAGAPPALGTMVHRMALRIAENRVAAGVHFPIDSVAGRLLAHVVEQHLMGAVGEGVDAPHVATFGVQTDWTRAARGQPDETLAFTANFACGKEDASHTAATLTDHKALWAMAKSEWAA